MIKKGFLLLFLSHPALAQPVGDLPTQARTTDGFYISWQEHLIDDPADVDFVLSGGDGLVVGDLDRDGYTDIVSVHESDSSYDSASFTPGFEAPPEGHVRIAFGSADPRQWHNITVAEGLDGDGDTDSVVGTRGEERLVWLKNPDDAIAQWTRHDISRRKRGMFDKFVAADMDGDGDTDFMGTRGDSYPYDGVFWLEQVRTEAPVTRFTRAHAQDSAGG